LPDFLKTLPFSGFTGIILLKMKKLQKYYHVKCTVHEKCNFHALDIRKMYLTWLLHLRLIILSLGGDVPIDNESFLMTDFVNVNIKLTQSLKNAHTDKVCIRVHRDEC
jgi:hypothetical protein